MEVLYPRCAGLDVHAGQVTACVRVAEGAEVVYHRRTVATTTRDVLTLADWLTAHACAHVAMEATGVYWKPVWHILGAGRMPRTAAPRDSRPRFCGQLSAGQAADIR